MISEKKYSIDVTPGIPRWLVGLIRLSIVAFVVAWIGWSIYGIHDNVKRNQWIVSSQFNPYASDLSTLMPSRDSWPMLTATKEYLALSPEQKVRVADAFYTKNVKPVAGGLHYDEIEVRDWFLKSANMSLSEAPLSSILSKLENKNIPYRIYSGYPTPKLSKEFFNTGVFEVAGITVVALWILFALLVGIYKTVLWIVLGFKGRR